MGGSRRQAAGVVFAGCRGVGGTGGSGGVKRRGSCFQGVRDSGVEEEEEEEEEEGGGNVAEKQEPHT